jgi:hypothetical protein
VMADLFFARAFRGGRFFCRLRRLWSWHGRGVGGAGRSYDLLKSALAPVENSSLYVLSPSSLLCPWYPCGHVRHQFCPRPGVLRLRKGHSAAGLRGPVESASDWMAASSSGPIRLARCGARQLGGEEPGAITCCGSGKWREKAVQLIQCRALSDGYNPPVAHWVRRTSGSHQAIDGGEAHVHHGCPQATFCGLTS